MIEDGEERWPTPPGPALAVQAAPEARGWGRALVQAHARRGTRGVRGYVRGQLRELAAEFLDGDLTLEEYLRLRPLILNDPAATDPRQGHRIYEDPDRIREL